MGKYLTTFAKLTASEALDIVAPGSGLYTFEDNIGGYNAIGALSGFPVGSVWRCDGQFLYGLVRHFKPISIIEIGTHFGASTCHLADAMLVNASDGVIYAVDIVASAGSLIPSIYAPLIRQIASDGLVFLQSRADESFDFIFEDASHGREDVAAYAREAQRVLKPGGIMVSHDACHWVVGEDVRGGYADAGIEPLYLFIEPSDCGISFWQKPMVGGR